MPPPRKKVNLEKMAGQLLIGMRSGSFSATAKPAHYVRLSSRIPSACLEVGRDSPLWPAALGGTRTPTQQDCALRCLLAETRPRTSPSFAGWLSKRDWLGSSWVSRYIPRRITSPGRTVDGDRRTSIAATTIGRDLSHCTKAGIKSPQLGSRSIVLYRADLPGLAETATAVPR